MKPLFAVSESTFTYMEKFFHRKGYPFTEKGLLAAIAENKSKFNVYWATIGLREVGTIKSVPVLKKLWNYPMQDVKCTSVLTVARLAGSEATPFFVQLLREPAYKEKIYAMWAISEVGDKRAVEAVCEFVDKIVHKKITQYSLDEIVGYLERVGGAKETIEKLTRFKEKKNNSSV